MPAGVGLRGATAFKEQPRNEICRMYGMRFKKGNGQRGNGCRCLNSMRVGARQPTPLPVYRIMGILKTENRQALLNKLSGVAAKRENIVNIK